MVKWPNPQMAQKVLFWSLADLPGRHASHAELLGVDEKCPRGQSLQIVDFASLYMPASHGLQTLPVPLVQAPDNFEYRPASQAVQTALEFWPWPALEYMPGMHFVHWLEAFDQLPGGQIMLLLSLCCAEEHCDPSAEVLPEHCLQCSTLIKSSS